VPRPGKNIVKRGDAFYFRFKVKGKSIRRSLGTNLTEARHQAAILRQQLRQGIVQPEPADQTLATFSNRWITEYVAQRRNPKGVELARQRLRDYVLPVLGSLEPGQVKTHHLRQLRASCEAARLAPLTVRHVLTDTRCLLRYAKEVELTDTVPSFGTVFPAIPEEAPKSLTDAEVDLILNGMSDRHGFVVRLALETGIRWGELKRLQWRHVIWKPRPYLVLEHTKSKKVRRVPLSAVAVGLLEQEKRQTSSVLVSPLRMKNPCSIYYRSEKRTGFKWHFHQLRHTFATRWLNRGGSKEALQKILGHSTIRLTERYGHLSDDSVFEEAERLDQGHTQGHRAALERQASVLKSSAH
jgi:integrase/recombinase XerD